MKWLWTNTTKLCFGEYAVRDSLHRFVTEGSRVLCTFGGGSIDKNGARSDVTDALNALHCTFEWCGGIPANPEYDRLVEIVAEVHKFHPDFLLAVGGGSVLDGTKFIALASHLGEGQDPYKMIVEGKFPATFIPFGAVMTIPATGSEWNQGFVISRRSLNAKVSGKCPYSFPTFSFLDPRYTMTLPPRQLANGAFDAFCHMMEQYCTPDSVPMFDDFWLSALKEVVTVGTEIIKPGSSMEMHERLMMAALFGLNRLFGIAKDQCWEIHMMGHCITAKYIMDHAATLAVLMPVILRSQINKRSRALARLAQEAFGVTEGSEMEKAEKAIEKIIEWRGKLGLPSKVSDVFQVKPGDAEELVSILERATHGRGFGYHGEFSSDMALKIYREVL